MSFSSVSVVSNSLSLKRFRYRKLKDHVPDEYKQKEQQMQQTITVEGMTCGHCKMRVEQAVSALKGVTKAVVNLEDKAVTVDYAADQVEASQIKEAIKASGYQVL